MSQTVQLTIPDEIARRAREIASRSQRRVEDVLVEWINLAAEDMPIDLLPDEQVIAPADLQMDTRQQRELGDLLARSRERQIDTAGRARLDQLMQVYRLGMVRKAQATKVAVERGLRPPLGLL